MRMKRILIVFDRRSFDKRGMEMLAKILREKMQVDAILLGGKCFHSDVRIFDFDDNLPPVDIERVRIMISDEPSWVHRSIYGDLKRRLRKLFAVAYALFAK